MKKKKNKRNATDIRKIQVMLYYWKDYIPRIVTHLLYVHFSKTRFLGQFIRSSEIFIIYDVQFCLMRNLL